ncbi:MAG TPA: hypothetical protein VGD17_10960 [Chitinophagaceae bacterium]
MKKTLYPILLMMLIACNNKTPDVSDIKIDLEVQRFDQDFFAIDTTNVIASLQQLQNKYPSFLNDFMINVLGLPLGAANDTTIPTAVKRFISDYRPIKDSVDRIFTSTSEIEKEVKRGLQFVKHYFPGYRTPPKLITFIGPLDAYYEASLGGYSDIITPDALGVGLQLHLGRNFSIYQSELGQRLYPTYISRRFEPEYIPVNCMKNVIDDLFAQPGLDKSLIEQMIEKGKRMYVLDKLLPYTHDTLKTGYTKRQLDGCYENEGNIWNFFLRNNLLYSIDPAMNKNYIQDGPKTEELGDASPGFIGLFVGWQIVKKYMSQNDDLTMEQMMKTDSKKIFQESKYKPK